ncbi:CRK1, partial [Symbiodinium sp. KB8]
VVCWLHETHVIAFPAVRKYSLSKQLIDPMMGKMYAGTRLTRKTEDAAWRQDGEVAVKALLKECVLLRRRMDNGHAIPQEDALKEMAVMQRIHGHAHLMGALDVLEDAENVFMVMPYGADLLDTINVMPVHHMEEVVKSIFRQIVQGVCHLHEQGFVHRDLSLENVVVADDGE